MNREPYQEGASDGEGGTRPSGSARGGSPDVGVAWSEFAAAVLAASDVDEICSETARRLVRDFGFSRSLVATVDPRRHRLVGRAGCDPSLPEAITRAMVNLLKVPLEPRDDGKVEAVAWCVLEAEQIHLPDARRYDFRPDETFARSFLVKVLRVEEVLLTPLLSPEGALGLLAVDRKGQEGGIDPGMRSRVQALAALVGTVLAGRESEEVGLATTSAGPDADSPGDGGRPTSDSRTAVPVGPPQPGRPRDVAQEILEDMPLALLVLDAEGKIRYLNRSAAALVGALPWSVIGKPWADVLRPARPDAFRRRLQWTVGPPPDGSGAADAAGRRLELRPDDGEPRVVTVDISRLRAEEFEGWRVLFLTRVPDGA